jgi:hypothetical protein
MSEVPKSEESLESRLDEALEMTFPASDPIAVHSSDQIARSRYLPPARQSPMPESGH